MSGYTDNGTKRYDTEGFARKIKTSPEQVEFQEVITEPYNHTPTRFTNGSGKKAQDNPAGTNEGSCKIFTFSLRHNLNKEQILARFGPYYQTDILKNPDSDNHGNIRVFMETELEGLSFDSSPLK